MYNAAASLPGFIFTFLQPLTVVLISEVKALKVTMELSSVISHLIYTGEWSGMNNHIGCIDSCLAFPCTA